jgi:uncharacterized protein
VKEILKTSEAIQLLQQIGCPIQVIRHSKKVHANAVNLAVKIIENGCPVEMRLVEVGALLHDMGRAITHQIDHGVIGAEMARSLHLDEKIVKIIENHIGAGIPKNEAAALGLPEKDFIPKTIEEKIVCYADTLAKGSKKIDAQEALEEFIEKLGPNHPAISRFRELHQEMLNLTSGKS